MTPFRDLYRQAYREVREDGKYGYALLRNPRARFAAVDVMRMRQDSDGLWKFRREFAYCEGWIRMDDRAAELKSRNA